MTVEILLDKKTFGFAAYWQGPVKEGPSFLDSHVFFIFFGPIIVQFKWKENT